MCGLTAKGRHCRVRGARDIEAINSLVDVVQLNPFLVLGTLRLGKFAGQEAVSTNIYTVRRLVNYMVQTGAYFCKYD